MTILGELYATKLDLAQKEEELRDLKEEFDNYRKIVECPYDNKRIREIKKYISWMTKDELKQKAKEVAEEETLEYQLMRTRCQERRRQREEKLKEKKKRAAERKALDELMEKERRSRARKNTEN